MGAEIGAAGGVAGVAVGAGIGALFGSGCLGCFENVSSRNEKTGSPTPSQLHATDAYR